MIKHGMNALVVTLFVTTFITLIFLWGVNGGKRETSIPESMKHHAGGHDAEATPTDMHLPKITGTPSAPVAVAPEEPPPPAPVPVQAIKPAATPTAAVAIKVDDPTYDKAAGQSGYAEVAALKKNPLAGGSPDAGKALAEKNCTSCHGASYLGDGPAGAALDPKPRNLTIAAEYKLGNGDLAVFRTIKYGSDGTGMAPWNGRMSDEEIWQTVNFIKSIQK